MSIDHRTFVNSGRTGANGSLTLAFKGLGLGSKNLKRKFLASYAIGTPFVLQVGQTNSSRKPEFVFLVSDWASLILVKSFVFKHHLARYILPTKIKSTNRDPRLATPFVWRLIMLRRKLPDWSDNKVNRWWYESSERLLTGR